MYNRTDEQPLTVAVKYKKTDYKKKEDVPCPESPSKPEASVPTDSGDNAIAPFLAKLSTILSVESPGVVRWSDDGLSFEIHDQKKFIDVVLPKYFRHNRYASFQRQLNYFGFRKLSKFMSDICTYSRPHFTRDSPHELKLIRRNKKSSSQKAKNAQMAAQHGGDYQTLGYGGRKRPLDATTEMMPPASSMKWMRTPQEPSQSMYITGGPQLSDIALPLAPMAPRPHPAALFSTTQQPGRYSFEEEMLYRPPQAIDTMASPQFDLGYDIVTPFFVQPSRAYYDTSLRSADVTLDAQSPSGYFPEPLPLLAAEESASKELYGQQQAVAPSFHPAQPMSNVPIFPYSDRRPFDGPSTSQGPI